MLVRFTSIAATVALAAAAFSQVLAQISSDRLGGETPFAQLGQFIGKVTALCAAVACARRAQSAQGQPTCLFVGANGRPEIMVHGQRELFAR